MNTSFALGAVTGLILCAAISFLFGLLKVLRERHGEIKDNTARNMRSIDQLQHDVAQHRRDIEQIHRIFEQVGSNDRTQSKLLFAATGQINTVIDALKAAQLWPISNDSSSSKTTSSVPASPSSSGSAPTPTS